MWYHFLARLYFLEKNNIFSMDKLKACFPIDILGSPLSPVDSVRNLGLCGLIQIFPCPSMFRMSAKVAL